MQKSSTLLLLILVVVLPSICFPLQSSNSTTGSRYNLIARWEPNTGNDLPDTSKHPNKLDQVETAMNDAVELASYVVDNADDDTTIFLNYFDEGDRANVKKVFSTIAGPDSKGNPLLSNILIQTTDTRKKCKGGTLAYEAEQDENHPYIVLCPKSFNKKAVTDLKGAPDPASNPTDGAHYVDCDDFQGHVSYKMNSLGATLLHEYTHYDKMVQSVFSAPILDQPDGYGPANVYNNLDKGLAKLNADSYMYYASEMMWREICQTNFEAPRAGIDDADPDCGGTVCQN